MGPVFRARDTWRQQRFAFFSIETFFCPFCHIEILILILTTKGLGIERGERGRTVWSEPSNLIQSTSQHLLHAVLAIGLLFLK